MNNPDSHEKKSIDIAQLWEICLSLEYNQKILVESLDKWIKARPHQFILDCACGTGFPSLNLLKRGYNITCTDGSAEMLRHFKMNAKRHGISKEPICLRWQELSSKFNSCFDIVMCRGSSLIYADGWDEEMFPQEKSIRESLESFHACLMPGGILYVDTTSTANLNKSEPEYSKLGPLKINGQEVIIEQTIYTNIDSKIRNWNTVLTLDGACFQFNRYSYYLPHERLFELMHKAGFKSIINETVRGEMYTVFSAIA